MTRPDEQLYSQSDIAAETSLPPFTVTADRGFLPYVDPPTQLPREFDALESILRRMPLVRADGQAGLLATGDLGNTVLSELPDLTTAVEQYRNDKVTIGALYRDYSFLASAYLLEPCHLQHIKGEGYGLGRQKLPAIIARPLAKSAEIAGFAPFMEYAGSYALYNYRLVDCNAGFGYDNIRLIRAFERGIADETSSEAGFVLIHVAMVSKTGPLVRGVLDALSGVRDNDSEVFERGLAETVAAMHEINAVMERMWAKSKPKEYTDFRTFIFGIKSQSMFPDGVIYEGVSDSPMDFRGESGANDSIIPLCDNLLQVTMPQTPLTAILKDFRNYRPNNHRRFLEWVKDQADHVGVKSFAMQQQSSAAIYLQALNQVRDFRWRHWCFAREYILKQTSHPTATGGSPIVTWLPNQLQAVLEAMNEVAKSFPGENGETSLIGCEDIAENAERQLVTLKKEVEKYRQERNVTD